MSKSGPSYTASKVIAAGFAGLVALSGVSQCDAKINKYEYYELADVVCERVSEDLGVKYDNASFRLLTGAKDEPISVYITAYDGLTPCFIRATMQDEGGKIYNSNPAVTKNNIIENLQTMEFQVEITPTTNEILQIIDKIGDSKTILTYNGQDDLKSSYIGGYFFSDGEDGYICSVVSSVTSAKHISYSYDDSYIKETSIAVPEEAMVSQYSINEYVADLLSNVEVVKEEDVTTTKIHDNFDGKSRGNSYNVKASNPNVIGEEMGI